MNCQQYELWAMSNLSDPEFAAHRKTCPECQSAYKIDEQLMASAANLNTNIRIPDQWPAIENEIHRIKSRNKRLKLIRYSLIAAASLLVIFTFFFQWSEPVDITQERILDRTALEYVKSAEETYLQALESLEARAENRLQNTDDQLTSLYKQKLDVIDQQIKRCRNALEYNPANAHIRRFLLAALETKQNTLYEIIKD